MIGAPDWFDAAVAAPAAVGEVVVDGTPVSFRYWGDSGRASHDLVLVHGGGAHARWWDHLAPLLAVDRRVVAIDLAGHGDSGHRATYSLHSWADQLAAVLAASGVRARPVVAGHSMGGMITAVLARRGAPELAGAIVIDSPIEPSGPGAPTRAEADSPSFGNARRYPSAAAAVARFRPIPAQDMLPYTAAHVAETSVREVDGGWTWKFDPAFVGFTGDVPRTLDGLSCPVAFIAGERGILSAEARAALDLSPEVAVVEIPDSGHAIMLDQPLALVSALRAILAVWS